MAERPLGSRRNAGQSGKNKQSKGRRWARRIVRSLVALILIGLVGATAIVVVGYQTTELPDPNADFQTATSFVYYNDGKAQLGSFATQNRQPLTFDEMPQSIKDALVSAENRDFWTDPGISITGMIRAAWAILRGESLQGGSTITQQYIKIMYLTSEQTLARKFKEVFLAYKLNKDLTKEQILEGYLNTIYFGRGAYGIQAAAKAFFDVDAEELTVPQAAALTAILNNPTVFDPDADDGHNPKLLERYRYVIQSMAETGAITPAEAAKHAKALPKFPEIEKNQRYGGPKGFLLKMVEAELLAAGFDSSTINGGGLKITTTFDKAAQNAAVKSAQKWTKKAADAADEKKSDLHAAIASVEVGTGRVLAVYGGPDYVANSRNWATTPRPTASTFKTYALAAGLEDGYSLRSYFNGNSFTPDGDPVRVRNEFNHEYGTVSLRRATAESINTAFVDLTVEMDDGPSKISKAAQAAGAPKGAGWDENTRIALGAAEVSPLDQAGAYATYANDGIHVGNHVVDSVTDAAGNVIYEAKPAEKRAVSEDIAHDVTYALSSVVEEGTGRTVQTLDRPVAGKTGTKDGVKDDITSAWFVAYTKQISTSVMYVAGDGGNEDLDDYARPGDSTFFGGTYPALTWADYMKKATKDQPVEEFEDPAWVNLDRPRDDDPGPQQQEQTRDPETEDPETEEPSEEPTEEPSEDPTEQPSEDPTEKPSEDPTEQPSEDPTEQPSEEPTEEPTEQPSEDPSGDADSGGQDSDSSSDSGGSNDQSDSDGSSDGSDSGGATEDSGGSSGSTDSDGSSGESDTSGSSGSTDSGRSGSSGSILGSDATSDGSSSG
ncbi:transglycosylase domain-containing protein [Microlunatus parietis]|uniref:Membrane peptidoglycan carboxypeptidase n=1 Tax=Microlunatus parietis TaxID=682979 RepID=A0A7Y9LDL5_9ACTN|nr:transglycosylase domain-containing protein [Microlunatus parietis]NYE72076.1 membrane peptidoglycan carboxypeptidase [Microlunatus parietis]